MQLSTKDSMQGNPNYDPCTQYQPVNQPLPDSVDWRSVSNGGNQPEPGLVLPPKDQVCLI